MLLDVSGTGPLAETKPGASPAINAECCSERWRALLKGKSDWSSKSDSAHCSLSIPEYKFLTVREANDRKRIQLNNLIAELEALVVKVRDALGYKKNGRTRAHEERDKSLEMVKALWQRTSQAGRTTDKMRFFRRMLSTHQRCVQAYDQTLADFGWENKALRRDLDQTRPASCDAYASDTDVEKFATLLLQSCLCLKKRKVESNISKLKWRNPTEASAQYKIGLQHMPPVRKCSLHRQVRKLTKC